VSGFDPQPSLTTARLSLRPLLAGDREGLFAAASDPEIWAQHPAPDRFRREVFDRYFDFLAGTGRTLVVSETRSGEIIGCSQYYPVPDHNGEVGIGFTFLARAWWGGAWNREMKAAMVAHVLKTQPRVWFHIGPDNKRSQIATTRLGARFAYDARLDLGSGASDYKCYTLTAQDWAAATGSALDTGDA